MAEWVVILGALLGIALAIPLNWIIWSFAFRTWRDLYRQVRDLRRRKQEARAK